MQPTRKNTKLTWQQIWYDAARGQAADILKAVYEKAIDRWQKRFIDTQKLRNRSRYERSTNSYVILRNIITGEEHYCPLLKGGSYAQLYARARDTLGVRRSHSLRLWEDVPWILPQSGDQTLYSLTAYTHRTFPSDMRGLSLIHI